MIYCGKGGFVIEWKLGYLNDIKRLKRDCKFLELIGKRIIDVKRKIWKNVEIYYYFFCNILMLYIKLWG